MERLVGWARRGALGLAFAAALAGCAGPDPGARRSVVLITVDTLRADHLGCYGFGTARTPNIDALARDGLRFEQAVSAVPITLPSHTTLMTGLEPPHHGVRHNGNVQLASEHRTLAEVLRAKGYATAAVVAAFVLDSRYGLDRGFDHYDDDIVPETRPSDPRRFYARRADVVTAAATAWIDRRPAGDRRPFFLWVHYYDPHVPYDPPREFADAFRDHPYDGEIAFVDSQIGVLMQYLREHGLLDELIVVLASDHGEGLGEHGEPTHMDLLYDSTVRVPLIFSNAGLFGRNRVVRDRVAGLVDVVPTLLGLLGIKPEGIQLDGVNLMLPGDPDRALYVETLAPYLDYGWSPLHALRRLGDKFILAPTSEYFELSSDPGELKNLRETAPAAGELARRLAERMSSSPPDAEAKDQGRALDDEARERLNSLGYIRAAPANRASTANPEQMIRVGARIDDALRLGNEGRGAEALREIESILQEFPDASRALYAATEIYDRLERFDEGEAALRRALTLAPTSDGWVHMAWYAYQRGDLASFELDLAQAEALDPLDGGVYMSRGQREFDAGNLDRALALFRKALADDPVRSGASAREAIDAVEAERARRRS